MKEFAHIQADPLRGEHIAAAYLAAPVYDRRAESAYVAFRDETVRQYEELRRTLVLSVSATDPYDDYQAMIADVGRGRLSVLSSASTGGHPFLSATENNAFRFVHDYHGHYMSGRDFSRHGEEAAWTRHSRMYSPLAREAMTSETRGQNSVFIWVSGGTEFPVQKVLAMPEWS
jgi:hypothetical protein